MEKSAFALAIAAGIIFTNTCCTIERNNKQVEYYVSAPNIGVNNYGAYLAGRIAHLRHDLNQSANYYMVAEKTAPKEQMLSSQLYTILASQGRIDEAIKYADSAIANGDASPFIHTMKSVYNTKQQNYEEALKDLQKCDNELAKLLINPLMSAWNYAGLGQYEKAIEQIKPLFKEETFKAMAMLHAGAISDYMGKNDEADKHYSLLMQIPNMKITFYPARIITNFYLRQNNKEKLEKAIQKIGSNNNIITKSFIEDIRQSDSSVAPILSSPTGGMSDVLFAVALLIQQAPNGDEVALLFSSLSAYINPEYDLSKILMGDILEKKELRKEANEIYANITENDYSYHSAQYKIAYNLIEMQQYRDAEKILLELVKNTPPSPSTYKLLGETTRLTKRNKDAVIYYQKALDLFPKEQRTEQAWDIIFAQGMAYSAMGDKNKAEKCFRKVVYVQPHPAIKNHLGYELLMNNKNIEEAAELIVAAYNQAQEEGSIVDSLGWLLYHLGDYEKSADYLEKASDLSPSEAVIYDHLGDAYWELGRKDEAIFQWNHAVGLNDDSGELDKETTKNKIENGKTPFTPLSYDKEKMDKILSKIK